MHDPQDITEAGMCGCQKPRAPAVLETRRFCSVQQHGKGMAPSVCRVVCIAALVVLLNEVLPVPARAPAASAGASVGGGRRKNARRCRRQDHVALSSSDCFTSNTATPAPASGGVGEGGDSRAVGARSIWLGGSGSGRGRVLPGRKEGSASTEKAGAGGKTSSVVGLRGGSTAAGEGPEEGTAGVVRSMQILVSTTKISSYIDAVRGWWWLCCADEPTRVCRWLVPWNDATRQTPHSLDRFCTAPLLHDEGDAKTKRYVFGKLLARRSQGRHFRQRHAVFAAE